MAQTGTCAIGGPSGGLLAASVIFMMCVLVTASPSAQTRDPIEAIATTLKQRTETGPAADFVERSRPAPDSLGYIPVNSPRRQPGGKPLNRDQIKAMEAELDAARGKHERLARRTTTGKDLRSAAGDPYVAPSRKPPARCVLTCEIR
jgi:hypothetical protein